MAASSALQISTRHSPDASKYSVHNNELKRSELPSPRISPETVHQIGKKTFSSRTKRKPLNITIAPLEGIEYMMKQARQCYRRGSGIVEIYQTRLLKITTTATTIKTSTACCFIRTPNSANARFKHSHPPLSGNILLNKRRSATLSSPKVVELSGTLSPSSPQKSKYASSALSALPALESSPPISSLASQLGPQTSPASGTQSSIGSDLVQLFTHSPSTRELTPVNASHEYSLKLGELLASLSKSPDSPISSISPMKGCRVQKLPVQTQNNKVQKQGSRRPRTIQTFYPYPLSSPLTCQGEYNVIHSENIQLTLTNNKQPEFQEHQQQLSLSASSPKQQFLFETTNQTCITPARTHFLFNKETQPRPPLPETLDWQAQGQASFQNICLNESFGLNSSQLQLYNAAAAPPLPPATFPNNNTVKHPATYGHSGIWNDVKSFEVQLGSICNDSSPSYASSPPDTCLSPSISNQLMSSSPLTPPTMAPNSNYNFGPDLEYTYEAIDLSPRQIFRRPDFGQIDNIIPQELIYSTEPALSSSFVPSPCFSQHIQITSDGQTFNNQIQITDSQIQANITTNNQFNSMQQSMLMPVVPIPIQYPDQFIMQQMMHQMSMQMPLPLEQNPMDVPLDWPMQMAVSEPLLQSPSPSVDKEAENDRDSDEDSTDYEEPSLQQGPQLPISSDGYSPPTEFCTDSWEKPAKTAKRTRDNKAWTNPAVIVGQHALLMAQNPARMEKALPGKKGKYFCSHCKGQFRTILELTEHMDEVRVKRPFHCPEEDCPWHICGFPTASEWCRHTRSQHGSVQVLMCKQCKKPFTRKDSLKRHLQLVHDNSESRYNRKQRKLAAKKRLSELSKHHH